MTPEQQSAITRAIEDAGATIEDIFNAIAHRFDIRYLPDVGIVSGRSEQAIIAAVEAKPERTWSTEYPSQPGLYWLRNYTLNHYPYRPEWNESELQPTVVEIESHQRCWFVGTEVPRERDDFLSAEWSGPIQP